jgi:hypothetical protein
VTSQTVGVWWNRTASEATAYSWVENVAQFNNSSGYCPQTTGNLNQQNVTTTLSSIMPWLGMRRCNITSQGIVTAIAGQCGYTDTPLTPGVNVGWILPAFHYATDHLTTADTYKWYISPTGAATDTIRGSSVTWKLHPAFIRNGLRKPYIVLGAYGGYVQTVGATSYLTSQAGVIPTDNTTYANFQTYAANVGNGFQLMDWAAIAAYQLTYLLEYGGFNSQTLLGQGNTTGSTTAIAGTTAAYGNNSFGTQDATTPVSFHGLENPYGDLNKYVEGVNINNGEIWVTDHGPYAYSTFGPPYVDTGLSIPTSGSAVCVTDIVSSATYDYLFLPATASGAYMTTKLCDAYTYASGMRILVNGGLHNYTSANGMFQNMPASSSTPSVQYGARLMYIPQ